MLSHAGRLGGRLTRGAGRLAVLTLLAVCYAMGAIAAGAVVTALTIAGAVRLGWSDTRKRAHGPA